MQLNFVGVIIEESLEDKSVLKKVKIIKTRIEKAGRDHKTPWVAKWTLHTIEIPARDVDRISKDISKSLDPKHPWYADFKNRSLHYIIFHSKVFKIDRSKRNSMQQYATAVRYGVSLGIPDYQLDFSPAISEWKRN